MGSGLELRKAMGSGLELHQNDRMQDLTPEVSRAWSKSLRNRAKRPLPNSKWPSLASVVRRDNTENMGADLELHQNDRMQDLTPVVLLGSKMMPTHGFQARTQPSLFESRWLTTHSTGPARKAAQAGEFRR
jgi:hypothetical protein